MEAPALAQVVREGESFLSFKRRSQVDRFPDEFASYAKRMGDVYFWPQGGFHVVTRFDLARTVMTSPDFSADRSSFFISRMPNLELSIIKDFFGVVGNMMVMSDDKQHTCRRNTAGGGLNEELLNRFQPRIDRIVDDLLQPLATQGSIEFVEDVARALPRTVLAELFSIPEKDRLLFNRCSNVMTGFFGGAVEYTNEVGKEVNDAAIQIREYFSGLIADRRKRPQDDFFSGMLEIQKEFGLTDDELISQGVMMLVAGQVTTTDQICNNAYLMLQRPGVYRQLCESPELLTDAHEEFKRIDPAVTFVFRVARARTTIGSQPVEPMDTVFIASHAVNRDPAEFSDPGEIVFGRKRNRHFAYGHGRHYCLGARLGRMQIDTLFRTMLRRFPELTLDPDQPAERDHYSLSFSGFKKIPVVRTPA